MAPWRQKTPLTDREHAMPGRSPLLALVVGLLAPACWGAEKETLFKATPLTAEKSFTEGVEGPNCDAKGNVYAVNFARQQTIGRVTPDGRGEVFVELPGKSVGN